MRRLFILFLVGHVVMDLAILSAGAFRFNADESVLALRVQPIQAQEPDLIPLLPRRDPTADRSPQSPTEPA